MERKYTRIDSVRQILDNDLKAIQDEEIKRCAYVHLYGVGQAAAFLAMKRGYSRKCAELAETAGMLHDYTKYVFDEEENHAKKSAFYAKQILKRIPEYTEEEIELIKKYSLQELFIMEVKKLVWKKHLCISTIMLRMRLN